MREGVPAGVDFWDHVIEQLRAICLKEARERRKCPRGPQAQMFLARRIASDRCLGQIVSLCIVQRNSSMQGAQACQHKNRRRVP